MDAARRVLLLEGGMGALWAVYGLVTTSVATVVGAWWLAVPSAVTVVALTYAEDHRMMDWDPYRRGAVAIAAVVVGVAVVWLLAILTSLAVVETIGVGITGMGAGLLGYRIVYGVVRPVPEARLAAESGQSV
ncbi:hypothetical protein [Halosimplex salinum]|uniref:hypothetical protein n=1 Tax=Halosimplex salinum TaxID=1710538 RepID=UPI000F4ABDBC|nr:hypothetical protein [Halosimplex salinum]